MLEACSESMDLISEHFYCQERPGVLGHSSLIADQIRRKVANHRRLLQEIPKAKGIRIAMDEWNYWYGPHVFGELGTRYFWKDGLGIARGLHEFFRSTDAVFMANYAQTVNVIGAIKTSKARAEMETTGLVLELYRREFGTIPVEVSGAPEPLDVSAALTADRKALTLAVVNPTASAAALGLSWTTSISIQPSAAWRIAHPDPMAFNDLGSGPKVAIQALVPERLGPSVAVPGYSVTIWRIPL
jgi:alpha-N-arabinofuranosidase